MPPFDAERASDDPPFGATLLGLLIAPRLDIGAVRDDDATAAAGDDDDVSGCRNEIALGFSGRAGVVIG